MPAPVRIGLAGYGLGGRYFHAPLIASAPDCEFLGVVTTARERQDQVAAELGRPAFASLEDLASAGAEAVAISTPAATHVTLTQQALHLGLAVVCDKPFALDAESARSTVRLAEQLKLPLTVYQNRRWDSDFLTLRQLLDQGVLGTLTAFESRFERFRPQSSPPRRAVAPCWTSAATWPIRPWSWPARSAAYTPRCITAPTRPGSTTTCSSP